MERAYAASSVSPYSPSGLVTTSHLFPLTLPRVTETLPKFTSFFFSFFAPSWLPLGLHFGAFWPPKLAPFWPNMRPSRLLKPHFFQKSNFQKNERHPAWEHDFDPKTTPKTTQDRPKTAPRRSSQASFFVFIFVFDFGTFLLPIWVPCWVPFWRPVGAASPPC